MKHLAKLLINGVKNGAKNGAKNGFKGVVGKRTLTSKAREVLPKPKSGTRAHDLAKKDFLNSRNNPDHLKNRYVGEDGRIFTMDNKGSKEKPIPGFIDKTKKHAREGENTEARIKNMMDQTDPNVDIDKFTEPQKGLKPGNYDVHHIQGLHDSSFLYDGLTKKKKTELTQYIEKTYGLFMGNHQGNAAFLPKKVHNLLHEYMRKTLKGRNIDISKLSLEERKKYVKQFAESQEHFQRMMYAFMQDSQFDASPELLKKLDGLLTDVRSA